MDPNELVDIMRVSLLQRFGDIPEVHTLTALTPIRRRVFLLYYHHELSIKAIAAEIGRSEGTIKSHLRNARLQLQEFLIPYLRNQHMPWLA